MFFTRIDQRENKNWKFPIFVVDNTTIVEQERANFFIGNVFSFETCFNGIIGKEICFWKFSIFE